VAGAHPAPHLVVIRASASVMEALAILGTRLPTPFARRARARHPGPPAVLCGEAPDPTRGRGVIG
jgi:hypothetical protein